MAVHGRFKQPCPVCGAPVQRIVYAENECNYCATCQTGGRLLADRSLSRLLKDDWPRSMTACTTLRINRCRFIDMSQASRSTGCSATRRGCGCCACWREERLNVTELTGVLGLAQSGVSRHLGLLKEAGLVVEERDGGFTYYRLSPALQGRRSPAAAVLAEQFEQAAADPAVRADEARLQEVLRLRKENFDTHAAPTRATPGSWCPAAAGPPGRARSACCCRRSRVADLGCGEGYLTIEAARWARA